MTKTVADRLTLAIEALEAGFRSEADRKRAMGQLGYAFEMLGDDFRTALLKERGENEFTAEQNALYYDFPSYPHQYSAKMAARIAAYAPEVHVQAAAMRDLRDAIKGAEVVKVERDPQIARVEAVRKSIVEQMAARKAQYVEALDMAREFNNLPVYVNAHYVHGHKGAVFLRHFFYLRGKLIPLQVLIAAAETFAREQEAAR